MRSLVSFFIGLALAGWLLAKEKFSVATTPGKSPNAVGTFVSKTVLQSGFDQLSLAFQSKISEQPHGIFIQYIRMRDKLEHLLCTRANEPLNLSDLWSYPNPFTP
jgi:hypothetical protein